MTDAHLVLGRIPAACSAASCRSTSTARARRSRSASPGRSACALEAAAQGIVEIVDNNMAARIRTVSVERGHDPRDFALVPFGGAGPLHGCRPGRAARHPAPSRPAAARRALDVGAARHRRAQRLRAHAACSSRPTTTSPRVAARVRRSRGPGAGLAGRRACAARRRAESAAGRPALPPPELRADGAAGRSATSRSRRADRALPRARTASSTPTSCPTRRSSSSRCASPPPAASAASPSRPSTGAAAPTRGRPAPAPRVLRRRAADGLSVLSRATASAPAPC